MASSAIIVYDHLITLDDELDLIWSGPWTVGKGLFILNRYYFLLSVFVNNYGLLWAKLNDNFCLRFFQWQGWTGWFACALAEVILQMRIYALFFHERRVHIIMITCFVLTASASAAIMGYVLTHIDVLSRIPFTDVTFCFSPNIPDWFFAFWIPILVFESLLCALALLRGFQTFRTDQGIFQSSRYLVRILVRDSIMYFLIMFVTYLTNLLVWVVGPVSLLEIPIGFTVALSCALGNRVILNVRKANREAEQNGVNVDGRPFTIEQFSSLSAPPRSPGEGLTDDDMIRLRSLRSHHSSSGRSRIVVV